MKTIIKKVLLIFTIIFLLSFILIEGLIISEGKKTEEVHVDYLIVLGARLYDDRPSPALAERLKIAKDYLIENPDVKVIVTGGQGKDESIPEAHAMKKYLMDNEIQENRIMVEDRSTSTYENMKFSHDLIRRESIGPVKVLVATNKHHIFRAKILAERQGLEAYGLPAKIPPSILEKSYIREYFAVVKSIIFDY